MKLTLVERLSVSGILPQQGDIMTQVVTKEILKKIELTDKEKKEHGIVPTKTGGLTWNVEKVEGVEFEFKFEIPEMKVLKDAVKTLDTKKGITQQNLGLCLKIQDAKELKK